MSPAVTRELSSIKRSIAPVFGMAWQGNLTLPGTKRYACEGKLAKAGGSLVLAVKMSVSKRVSFVGRKQCPNPLAKRNGGTGGVAARTWVKATVTKYLLSEISDRTVSTAGCEW